VATQIRGAVIYPGSAILPQYEPVRTSDPEILPWLLEAIRSRGMRSEAWTEFGFYAYWTPDATKDSSKGAILDKHPELAALDREGKPLIHNPQWGDFYALCPANPKSQDILLDLYLETLGKYPFDGLHLDRVRFPDESFCHCGYCREHFEKDTGVALKIAAAADVSDAQKKTLDQWRKQQTCAFVERVSKAVRERFPNRQVTSAVVPPYMIDAKGQDWPVWVERHWVDSVSVMLYAEDITEALARIRERLPADAPVYAGLDAAGGADRLIKQIEQARRDRFPGVTVWYSGIVDPVLDKLHAEVFSSIPADSPRQGGAP
jgi:uncharacterized lipoprotein YddW (UPF0748 family)